VTTPARAPPWRHPCGCWRARARGRGRGARGSRQRRRPRGRLASFRARTRPGVGTAPLPCTRADAAHGGAGDAWLTYVHGFGPPATASTIGYGGNSILLYSYLLLGSLAVDACLSATPYLHRNSDRDPALRRRRASKRRCRRYRGRPPTPRARVTDRSAAAASTICVC